MTTNLSSMISMANTESLKGIVGEEGFVRIATAFLEESVKVVEELEMQLDKGSSIDVRHTAHKLKGMCSSVTANDVAALSYRIQKAAQDERLDEAAQAFKELKPAFEQLVIYLRDSIKKQDY